VLVEKMAERYRRAGYLNATVSYQLQTEVVPETQSTGQESVTYLITISEGMELPVKRVSFVGNQQVATSTLKKELTKQQKSAVEPNILSPRYAVDEELQSHSTLIEGLYQNLGFSGTRVSYEIVPLSKNRVEIHYIIQEGVRSSVKISSISGIPLGVLTAQLPAKSINAVEANKLISNIAQNLRDAGYQSSSIILIRSSTEDSYTIEVTPGTPVTLARISVEGAISVPTTTILHTLKLREGDPWSQTLLEERRRKLLKLGLFSSVIFSDSSSANPTQRELTIKVIERPLSYLRFGGGANSQFGAHIFGEASDRSLFLDGREVSLRADLYVLPGTLEVSQGIASILYAIPSVLDSPYSFVIDLTARVSGSPSATHSHGKIFLMFLKMCRLGDLTPELFY
jgi:outer membrane protein assembly factor BamA